MIHMVFAFMTVMFSTSVIILFFIKMTGRMFTLFRDPIERAASLFYFIQDTQWKQPGTRNDQFADITIEQFYRKGYAGKYHF